MRILSIVTSSALPAIPDETDDHCSASAGLVSMKFSRNPRRSGSSPTTLSPRLGRETTSRPASCATALMPSRSFSTVERLTEKRSAMAASVTKPGSSAMMTTASVLRSSLESL